MPRSKNSTSKSRVDSNGLCRPVGKPRGLRRDRDCRTCRQRDLKCDLNRPSCGQCLSAQIPCKGYPPRVIWVDHCASRHSRVPQTDKHVNNQPEVQQLGSTNGTLQWRDKEHDLPSSASGSVPPIHSSPHTDHLGSPNVKLSGTDQNSFIRPLVALCQEIIQRGGDDLGKGEYRYLSPEVISLISRLRDFAQARIDTHPQRRHELETENIWESEVASRHRLDTLVGLKETLAIGNPFALIGIAAFAFFEVCDSGFGQWQRHLVGAKSLLDYHCTCIEELDNLSTEVTGLKAIISRLVWFDTIGAIGRGTADMIFDPWHRAILDDEFFRIVGCPAETFCLFAKIAAKESTDGDPDLLLSALEQLLKLEQGESEWSISANIFRCAAVLAILTKSEEQRPATAVSKKAMVTLAVDRLCRMLAALQPTCQFYIHLAVPAYLAGIHATTSEQCHTVREYWHNCSHAGVRRYPDGLARCEDHWKAQGLDYR